MLPAESIIRAASRWLGLLRRSSLSQAWSLIQSDPNFTDLTRTQYASGLDWLRVLQLVVEHSDGLLVSPFIRALPKTHGDQILFERSLEHAELTWLPDADIWVTEPGDLPQDALDLAHALKLTNNTAFQAIKRTHGKVDLARRTLVGSAGERLLVSLLETYWPNSTSHVSLTDDGFGYDVIFQFENIEKHLEVKSTTRRGRLSIFMSRHEHQVGLTDPNWHLIVLGLNEELQLQALATANFEKISVRAPQDVTTEALWQNTSHQLSSIDLHYGLPFLPGLKGRSGMDFNKLLHDIYINSECDYGWMPRF